jgi:putative addiction module component (TIGR02574 family)
MRPATTRQTKHALSGFRVWKFRLQLDPGRLVACAMFCESYIMNDLRDIFKLSVAERIQLVEDLWDSIAADTDGPPISDAVKRELDRRMADLEANPSDVLDWDDVRARLWSRVK